jgi:peroxiredoxin
MFCQARLVELQSRRQDFRKHDIAMFAILADPLPTLGDFAVRQAIDFPLLSDEWGRAVRSAGMRDEQVQQHNEEAGILVSRAQLDDVAYPGMFLIDGDGIVRERHLPADIRIQESAASLLEEGFGVEAEPLAVRLEAGSGLMSACSWTDVAAYRPWLHFRLNVVVSVVHGPPPGASEAGMPFGIEVVRRQGLEIGSVSLRSRRSRPLPGDLCQDEYHVTVPLLFTEDVGAAVADVRVCHRPPGQVSPADVQLSVPIDRTAAIV